MKKVMLNTKYIIKLSCKWTACIYSFIGFIGVFISLSEIIPETWSFMCKLLFSGGFLAAVWIISLVICALWFEKKKWVEAFEVGNNCHVYVQYGDVFSENEVGNPNERRTIVIPVNRCFDTVVDNDLVSEKSLHGIAFKKLYADGLYDESTLNDALQCDLINRQGKIADTITVSEKRRGNSKRYQVGTTAEIQTLNNCTYFFLALSTFDVNLTAHTTQEEYVMAMQRLIEYCSARSQGYPIVMPLIGAGLSRTMNDERSILEFIIKLLKMNKNLINSDIHIVVRNSGKKTISIAELGG